MSYNNSIFNIISYIFYLDISVILVKLIMCNITNSENIFNTGFWLFDGSINIVLTFGFSHDITILKLAIFDKVDYIDIEPAPGHIVPLGYSFQNVFPIIRVVAWSRMAMYE